MCIQNGDEPRLTCKEWGSLFPDGVSYTYMCTTPLINRRLLDFKKGGARRYMREAALINAELARQNDLSPIIGHFPLLKSKGGDNGGRWK